MKETKHAAADPAARAAMHDVMAAFEAFKAANDERLNALETKRGDALLEEKVARIDATLQAAQGRLDRALSDGRRPALAGEGGRVVVADERKQAWDGYLKTGQSSAMILEAKGLNEGVPTAGGYVGPSRPRV